MSDDRPTDDTGTREVLNPENFAELRRQLAEARDNPERPSPSPTPGVHIPIPPPPTRPARSRLPEPAVPGSPPPPLPWTGESTSQDDAPEAWIDPEIVDPVLQVDLGRLEVRQMRLRATPAPPWSVAAVLEVFAPARRRGDAIIDEQGMNLTALRVPEQSLDPHPEPVPLLSRLRVLHARLLGAGTPLSASWAELAGRPAVLDRLAGRPGGRLAQISIAAELAPDEGLLVLASAPPVRAEALEDVVLPLALQVRAEDDAISWPLPPAWVVKERLDITTDTARATVELERLWRPMDLDDWTRAVFERAPYLRDMRTVDDRMMQVRGVERARLQRFHWQPSGRGRQLTTVVTGLAGSAGISFVQEGPLEADGATPVVDPLEILATVEVLPGEPVDQPETRPVPAPTTAPSPPPARAPTGPFAEARAAQRDGDARQALALVEQAMSGDPFPPLDVLEQAAAELDLEALRAAAMSVQRHPTETAALHELGVRLLEVGLFRSAVAPLQAVAESGPGRADHLVPLAHALEQQRRHHEAVRWLREHRTVIEGHFPALYRLAHNCLLTGDLAGLRDAVASLPPVPPGDQAAEAMAQRMRQAVARADTAASAPVHFPLDAEDLRGWHYVITGGILTGLAPRSHEGMNGRFALLYDTYATCYAGLLRLTEVVLAWQEPPARVLAFPDRDSRALALAANRLLRGTVEDYEGGADEALIVAYDLGRVDTGLLDRLYRTGKNQVLFAHTANWTAPPLMAPDVVTHLAQSVERPWGASMQVHFEPGAERPTVTELPPDDSPPEVLAEHILAADPEESSLEFRDTLEHLRTIAGLTATTATGALRSGVRDRFWPYEVVGSARFT